MRNTSLNTSWLGTPFSSGTNRRSRSILRRPKSDMSVPPVAPHSTAARATKRISNNGYDALAARGSRNLPKYFLSLPICPPLQIGSHLQNPVRSLLQQAYKSQKRFPCPAGEGWSYPAARRLQRARHRHF